LNNFIIEKSIESKLKEVGKLLVFFGKCSMSRATTHKGTKTNVAKKKKKSKIEKLFNLH
jgi:hypothetical protein